MFEYTSKGGLWVILICSVVTFLFGSWVLYRNLIVKNTGVKTEGTIIEYHSTRKNPQAIGSKTMVHTPVFSYVVGDSVKFNRRSSVYAEQKPYEIGDTIMIQYDPKNFKNAEIVGTFNWQLSAFLIGFGLFGTIILSRKLTTL